MKKVALLCATVLTVVFFLSGCKKSTNDIAVESSKFALQPEMNLQMELPAGVYAQQLSDQILFLGTVWNSSVQVREVTAFSVTDQQIRWQVELPAPPLQAIQSGDLYLVATSNQDGNGHLVALQVSDGTITWDLALGDTGVAISNLHERVWVNSAQGVFEIDPQTGTTLAEVVSWQENAPDGDVSALTIYSEQQTVYLAASNRRDVWLYHETPTGWESVWRFRASSRVLELHPVAWQPGEPADILLLGHSVAYAIQPDGSARWRVDNSDLNRHAYPLRCTDTETLYAFGNVMSGIYVVNETGLARSWEMPGGAFKLGFIPLPLPANLTMGITVGDLDNDAQDEIIARSSDKVFVFDCQGTLLAEHTIGETQDGTLVTEMRTVPQYPPMLIDRQLFVAAKGQVDVFSFEQVEP